MNADDFRRIALSLEGAEENFRKAGIAFEALFTRRDFN